MPRIRHPLLLVALSCALAYSGFRVLVEDYGYGSLLRDAQLHHRLLAAETDVGSSSSSEADAADIEASDEPSSPVTFVASKENMAQQRSLPPTVIYSRGSNSTMTAGRKRMVIDVLSMGSETRIEYVSEEYFIPK